jgi:hypothetical protein
MLRFLPDERLGRFPTFEDRTGPPAGAGVRGCEQGAGTVRRAMAARACLRAGEARR